MIKRAIVLAMLLVFAMCRADENPNSREEQEIRQLIEEHATDSLSDSATL